MAPAVGTLDVSPIGMLPPGSVPLGSFTDGALKHRHIGNGGNLVLTKICGC